MTVNFAMAAEHPLPIILAHEAPDHQLVARNGKT
jgi:hypothetical protein